MEYRFPVEHIKRVISIDLALHTVVIALLAFCAVLTPGSLPLIIIH